MERSSRVRVALALQESRGSPIKAFDIMRANTSELSQSVIECRSVAEGVHGDPRPRWLAGENDSRQDSPRRRLRDAEAARPKGKVAAWEVCGSRGESCMQ